MKRVNLGYASFKKLSLLLLISTIVFTSCKKENKNTSPTQTNSQQSYSQYFPDWDGLRLEDPANAVLVEDETLYCRGSASNPFRFVYKGVTYQLTLNSQDPINLPSGGTGIKGWYFEGTVIESGTSFSCPVEIGRFQDFKGDHYKLEFTSIAFSGVFKSKEYIKRF